MHDIVNGKSLNELAFDSFKFLLDMGEKVESRNGFTLEAINSTLVLGNPQARHLYLEGRKSNIYAMIIETLWIMSNNPKIDPIMPIILPRVKDFSDDQIKWRDYYGSRIFNYDQIQNVVECFKRDGINTRRALICIYDPAIDSVAAHDRDGLVKPKAVSCNNIIYFWIRNDLLYCKVCQRSGDCCWGSLSINTFEFTFLMEIVLALLQKECPDTFGQVTLGEYIHNPVSFHVYDFTLDQIKKTVENKEVNKSRFTPKELWPIQMPLDYSKMKTLFSDIWHYFLFLHKERAEWANLNKVFELYGIPTENNTLYSYVLLGSHYLRHKLDILSPSIAEWKQYLSPDLIECIKNCSFTPKPWLEIINDSSTST